MEFDCGTDKKDKEGSGSLTSFFLPSSTNGTCSDVQGTVHMWWQRPSLKNMKYDRKLLWKCFSAYLHNVTSFGCQRGRCSSLSFLEDTLWMFWTVVANMEQRFDEWYPICLCLVHAVDVHAHTDARGQHDKQSCRSLQKIFPWCLLDLKNQYSLFWWETWM